MNQALGKITGKPNQMMAWSKRAYLQLITKLKVEIDLMNYPMKQITSPRMVNKEYATQVIDGWNSRMIKWIPISDDDLKLHEKELAELLKKGGDDSGEGDKGGGTGGGGNGEDNDTGMPDENRR